MSELQLTELIDPMKFLPLEDWIEELERHTNDRGKFTPLGADHSAVFIEGNKSLLVTFEMIDTVRGHANLDVPLGWDLAQNQGWSQLCLLAHSKTWFRDAAIYEYFDRLVDQEFFDDFDQVVFYGDDSCGYAAAAFSVIAPGATVVAVNAQATLDPSIVAWDPQLENLRKTEFTGRYGYAPEMIEAADQAFFLFDPAVKADLRHAILFKKRHSHPIRTANMNGQIENFLLSMDILKPILIKAMAGELVKEDFYKQLRKRHQYQPYLRSILSSLEDQDRPYLAALLCRTVNKKIDSVFFKKHYKIAVDKLAASGNQLPSGKVLVLK